MKRLNVYACGGHECADKSGAVESNQQSFRVQYLKRFRVQYCKRCRVWFQGSGCLLVEVACKDRSARIMNEEAAVVEVVYGQQHLQNSVSLDVRVPARVSWGVLRTTSASISCVFHKWWRYALLWRVQAAHWQPDSSGDESSALRGSLMSTHLVEGRAFCS